MARPSSPTPQRPGKRGFKGPLPAAAPQPVAPQTSSWRLLLTAPVIIKRHIVPVSAVVFFPPLLLQLSLALISSGPEATGLATLSYALSGLSGLAVCLNSLAGIYFYLSVVGGAPTKWRVLYTTGITVFPRLVLLVAAIAVAIALQLLRFVLPGVRAFRRYALAPYFMVDQNLGVRQAMDQSRQASDAHAQAIWSMFVIVLCFVAAAYLVGRYLPVYSLFINAVLGGIIAFVPTLRYQELTSVVRNGSLALVDTRRSKANQY